MSSNKILLMEKFMKFASENSELENCEITITFNFNLKKYKCECCKTTKVKKYVNEIIISYKEKI